MSKIQDNIISLFNRIFRRNTFLMIPNVSKQNYDEYHRTYDTLSKVSGSLKEIDAFLIGGISAAIQTNQDLYRKNDDLDIMCKEDDLEYLIDNLKKLGYVVDDKRDIRTGNIVDKDGNFHPADHELNADTNNKKILGIGIFTYQIRENEVITHSYAFHEKEGRVIGAEKVMPKELFDLMYDSRVVDYKGMKLKSQSKEYIFLTKSRGKREKDKLDASIIEPYLDDDSKARILRIKELEAKSKTYRVLYDKDGKVESRTQLPTLEEKVNTYLDSLYMENTTKTPEQIISDVLQSDEYQRIIGEHPEVDKIIDGWKSKSANYTYKDKIELLTKHFSNQLNGFSKEAIDNALFFLQNRHNNHGKDNNDIELSSEAIEIFGLMKLYEKSIKDIFVDNNIDLTHITSVAPEMLEGGVLRKSIDRANNYETERVNGVFASSSPIDGNNPYVARNSSGMIRLGKSTYIYGSDIIDVTQDAEGRKHAVLKNPNYIYHINPDRFNPVCNLTINPRTHKPIFEFSEEWISDSDVDISDPIQVRGIEQVSDITSLLGNYTILCDTQSQKIGIRARQSRTKDAALRFIEAKIKDGSVRNINHETGINDRELSGVER